MEHFEIIKRSGETIDLGTKEPFRAVSAATHTATLMGDDYVTLTIISTEMLTFDKGDVFFVDGDEYTMRTRAKRQMYSDSHFAFEVVFYGVMYELMKSMYRDTDADGKSTTGSFDLMYSIKDFVMVIIYNVNRDYPGLWVFDEDSCPDTETRQISFSNQNCLNVLQTLCSEFDLEFRITQSGGVRTIHIGEFGDYVNPPAGNTYFEWGKGGGLFTLTDEKVDDTTIKTRLWVEGGTQNIKVGYRDYSERLQLPYPRRLNKNEHTLSDGTIIPAESEMIGIDDDNKRYFEDEDLRDQIGSDEDSIEYDEIYPTRTGTVTAVFEDDILSFTDNTMDFDLNEKDEDGDTEYLIDGTSAKINFTTGKLAGQQFELSDSSGYNHSTKTFKLLSYTDSRGLTIPTEDSEAYRISVGDEYNITDINLPDSYVENKEEDLWYAGYEDFIPLTQASAQYSLTLDRSYFMLAMPDDSTTNVFKVGDYVPVKDERFGIEKHIRINQVVRNLLQDYDYTLTLSDITTVSIQTQTVLDVISINKIVETNGLKDLNKAKRGWRTTEELKNMVYDTDGYFDAENIRPNSIETNMLTVGATSQQFVLIDVVIKPNVNGVSSRIDVSAGVLSHFTIEEDDVRLWQMSAAEFTLDSTSGYYLFAKCSKTGENGVWYITQDQLTVEIDEDPNNYYFLVGILSSTYKDSDYRDFSTTYGFTRINGRTITSGRIQNSAGDTYFDLDLGEIGGRIVFIAADGTTKTLIDGGYISTESINSSELTTSQLETLGESTYPNPPSGERIRIKDNKIVVLNGENKEKLIIDGAEYTSHAEILNDAATPEVSNITNLPLDYSSTVQQSSPALTYSRSLTIGTFTIPTSGFHQVRVPALYFRFKSHEYSNYSSSTTSGYVGYISAEVMVGSQHQSVGFGIPSSAGGLIAVPNTDFEHDQTTNAFLITTTEGGEYTVTIEVSLTIESSWIEPTGNLDVEIEVRVADGENGDNLTYESFYNYSRLYSNGFLLRASSQKYFSLLNATNEPLINARDGDYYLEMVAEYISGYGGYRKYSNGQLEVWGYVSSSSTTGSVTFPNSITFVNAYYNIQTTISGTNTTTFADIRPYSLTTSGFSYRTIAMPTVTGTHKHYMDFGTGLGSKYTDNATASITTTTSSGLPFYWSVKGRWK